MIFGEDVNVKEKTLSRYRVALNFCGSFILRVGDISVFCKNKILHLVFLVGN